MYMQDLYTHTHTHTHTTHVCIYTYNIYMYIIYAHTHKHTNRRNARWSCSLRELSGGAGGRTLKSRNVG